MQKKLPLVVWMLLLLSFAGCTTSTSDAVYKSVYVAGVTYDTVMKAASDAEERNLITHAEREEINRYGSIFYDSYQSACSLMKTYAVSQSPDKSTFERLIATAEQAGNALNDLLFYANDIGLKIKEVR